MIIECLCGRPINIWQRVKFHNGVPLHVGCDTPNENGTVELNMSFWQWSFKKRLQNLRNAKQLEVRRDG